MTAKEAFEDRKRSQEEEYFHRQEQEFIEKMRQRMRLEAERRELGEHLGVADEEVLRTLQELGYTRETIALLYLAPLLQVAWADGRISPRESSLILRAAHYRGIDEQHPAYAKLTAWLDERPPEEFFAQTLRAIGLILQALPPKQAAAGQQDLLTCCQSIAEASGGLMGLIGFGSKVSKEEQALLERIVAELRTHHEVAQHWSFERAAKES